MPINTYEAEYNAICKQFRDNWTTLPGGSTMLTPVAWENITFRVPDPPSEWVSFSVLNGESVQTTIGAPTQNNLRCNGVVSVNIYVVDGDGKALQSQLIEKVCEIFRNQPINGIFFRTPAVSILGEDGGYYRANVSIGFYRDAPLA